MYVFTVLLPFDGEITTRIKSLFIPVVHRLILFGCFNSVIEEPKQLVDHHLLRVTVGKQLNDTDAELNKDAATRVCVESIQRRDSRCEKLIIRPQGSDRRFR